jgi:hypothetical protein
MKPQIKMSKLRAYHRMTILTMWLLWWHLVESDAVQSTFYVMVAINFGTGVMLEKINQMMKNENRSHHTH